MNNRDKIIQDYIAKHGIDPNQYRGSSRYRMNQAIEKTDAYQRTRKYQNEWLENEAKAKKRDADKLLKTIQKFRKENSYDPETERLSNLLDKYRDFYGTNVNSPVTKGDLEAFAKGQKKYPQYFGGEVKEPKKEESKKDDESPLNKFMDFVNGLKDRGDRTVAKAVNSAGFNVLDNLADKLPDNKFGDAIRNMEFGVPGAQVSLADIKKAEEEKSTTLGGKALDVIGEGAGYLVPGTGAYKLVKGVGKLAQGTKAADKLAKLPKVLQRGLEGAGASTLFAGADAGLTEAIAPDERNLSDHLKRAGIEVGLGAVGDAVVPEIAGLISKLGNPKLPPAPENLQPLQSTINKMKPQPKGDLGEFISSLKKQPEPIKPKEQFENISPEPQGKSLAKVKEIDPNLPRQEEQFILSQNKKPIDLKRGWDKFYQNTFDQQHLIAGISNDAKVKASNSRQTQGIVDYIAEKGLVDTEGRTIGESLKDLTQSLPLGKEEDFWRYMGHQHNIARSQEGKNVFSQFDSEASDKVAKELLAEHPEFKDAGEKVTNWINTFMGSFAKPLVGEDTLKMWKEMYPNYFPVNREVDPLKQASFNGTKRGFVNHHNTVKKAKGAKADLSSNIKDPISNIANLVNRTVKAYKNNEVGLAIVDEVKKGHLDDLFEIVQTKKSLINDINKTLKEDGIDGLMDNLTEQFDDVFKQAEKGNNIVKVMDNGNEILLKVKDIDYLKALQSLSDGTGKSAAEQFERAARRVARPIKELITGKNPLFAVFNLMRDTPGAFLQGQEKNPIKFSNRYMRALKEITHNSKGFQEFAAQGGMQSGFFKNDVLKTTSQLKNYKNSPLRKLVGSVEAFNNLIEATPRYMEYLATLEKGGSKAQAIYNAAEVTTNFARNGKWGKFFDSFVLYLNPALQGLDKMVRQIKNKPLQTALKSAGVITVPQVITEFVNNDNPNYQSLDQRLKDDFFLIPNQFGPKDEQGNAETFFRIPKTRQYSVLFAVLTNRIGEMMRGKSLKDASKGVVGSFDRNFSIPTRPIWSPFSDVARNKDWKNAPINSLGMTLDNRSNYLKYDERTSEIGKVLAEMLNKQPIEGLKYSPKDIDYLIDSYTGIIGDILLPVATKNESVLGVPQKKFIADSVYSNQSVNDFYDNMQKLRNKASDKNILENIPSKAKTKEEAQRNNLDKLSRLISSLNKDIKQTTDEEKQRKLRKEIIKIAQQGNKMYDQFTR